MRAPLVLVLVAACAGSPGPDRGVGTPAPATPTASRATPTAATAETSCADVAEKVANVEPLLAAGHLHRVLVVMDALEARCPSAAPDLVEPRMRALAEIGDDARALTLAAAIEADTSRSVEARESAKRARELALSRAGTFADTDAAKSPMRKRYAEAVKAFDEKRFADAKQAYLEAWAAWHPNGQALFGAGAAALEMGDRVAARRLFDRAILELERVTGARVSVDVPDGFDDVSAAAWAPRRTLLGVGHGRRISLLDTLTWRERVSVDAGRPVHALAFSGDGKQVIVGSDDPALVVLSTVGGKRLASLEGHKAPVAALATSADGKWMASGSWDETIRLWDAANGKTIATLTGHGATVTHLAFDPKAERLASASDDQTLKIWSMPSGSLERTVKYDGPRIEGITFEDSGRVLAVGTRGGAVRFDARTGDKKAGGAKDPGPVGATSDDGALRARTARDRPRLVVDVIASGAQLDRFERHTAEVRGLAFDPTRRVLASSWSDGIVRFFPLEAGPAPAFAAWNVGARAGRSAEMTVGFDVADGSAAIAATNSTADLRVSPYGSDYVSLLVERVSNEGLARLVFSPDGRTLVGGDWSGGLDFFTIGKQDILPRHESAVTDLALSSDGAWLGSASRDKTVVLHRVERGSDPVKLEHPVAATAVAFSPDGGAVVTGAEDALVRWWSPAGAPLLTGKGHAGAVRDVACSPDGRHVASASDDASVILWSSSDGTVARKLEGHRGPVRALTFIGDAVVASGSEDGSVILWDRESGAPLAYLFGERGEKAAYARVPSGAIELFGEAQSIERAAVCRVGALSYPYALCRERFEDGGILPKALVRDATSSAR